MLLVTVAACNCHTANAPVVPVINVQAWAPPAPGNTGPISEIICFQNFQNCLLSNVFHSTHYCVIHTLQVLRNYSLLFYLFLAKQFQTSSNSHLVSHAIQSSTYLKWTSNHGDFLWRRAAKGTDWGLQVFHMWRIRDVRHGSCLHLRLQLNWSCATGAAEWQVLTLR